MSRKTVLTLSYSIGVLLLLVLGVNVAVYGGMKAMFPNASLTGEYPPDEQDERDGVIPTQPVRTDVAVPAQQAVDSIMKKEPAAVKDWQGGEPNQGTPASVYAWVCGELKGKGIPQPLVANSKTYTEGGRKNFTTIVAYAYGAGEGGTAVNSLKDQARDCGSSGGLSDTQSPVSDSNGGFTAYYFSGSKRVNVNMWSLGDVVLSVSSTSNGAMTSATDELDDYARGLLRPMCLSLRSPREAITRNPYVNPEAYTGWEKGRKVDLNRNIAGINPGIVDLEEPLVGHSFAIGRVPGENDIPLLNEIPGKTIEYTKVRIPKAPLAPYPDILPDAVDEPLSKPKNPHVPESSVTVAERVRDDDGPGCGWAFAGQAAPKFDDTAEKEAADQRENEAQTKMQTEQKTYYNQVADYVRDYEAYALSVAAYKDYYDEVEEVRDVWNDIKNKRADYREKLDQYYEDKENREDFIKRQDEAQKRYDEALEKCRVYNEDMDEYNDAMDEDRDRYEREAREWRERKLREWEDNRPEPEPTPEPQPTEEGEDGEPAPPPPPPAPEPEPDIPDTPPANEVRPVGDGIDKPAMPDGVSCPAQKPRILNQAIPAEPKVPAKPDVELPDAWDDIPN